jgi:diguanylate cyclase (GGDEF)-like protein
MSTIPLPRPKILVVDDTPANLIAMRRLLAKVEVELIETRSGNEALAACLDHEFALVLLDVNMPEMDGFEVAELLAEESRTRDTPIIFVTAAYADDLNRLKGYSFGAVDYIAKPINDTILLSKIRVFLELYRSRTELKVTLQQLSERNDQLQREVSERQRAEEKARHEATHDALTGLPNRLLFMDRLHNSIERARRRATHCALLYIDIDGFKPVNDSYGHTVGDSLLCAIAMRMSQTIRKIDSVARLGGDEFGVIIEEPVDDADAIISAERLNRALREPYMLDSPDGRGYSFEVIVSASIGVAMFPEHAQTTDALIRVADDAMYRAKRGGKNLCILARPEQGEDSNQDPPPLPDLPLI